MGDDHSEGEGMSATMTLKHKMARRTDAAWNFQHSLMIAGLLLAFGLVNLLVDGTQSSSILQSVFPGAPEAEDATNCRLTASTGKPCSFAAHDGRAGLCHTSLQGFTRGTGTRF